MNALTVVAIAGDSSSPGRGVLLRHLLGLVWFTFGWIARGDSYVRHHPPPVAVPTPVATAERISPVPPTNVVEKLSALAVDGCDEALRGCALSNTSAVSTDGSHSPEV